MAEATPKAIELKVKHIKIISWNVNGLQGILKKGLSGKKEATCALSILDHMLAKEKPDILCLQEIRCSAEFEWKPLPYTYTCHCESKKGYSGTLLASSIEPKAVSYEIEGITEKEGRAITAEFDDFFLVNVYVPNTGSGRMRYRMEWEAKFRQHIAKLQATGKGVIVCGDLNVMPTDLDLNTRRDVPGSSQDEQEAFFQLLRERKLLDTFRALHSKAQKWSWTGGWKGARIDFFLIPTTWLPIVKVADILDYKGSDHKPVALVLEYSVPA